MGYRNRIAEMIRKWGGVELERKIWYLTMKLHLDATAKYKNNPTSKMKASEQFYRTNIEQIKRISDFLADDKSKQIYQDMFLFRATYDRRYNTKYELSMPFFSADVVRYSANEVFVDIGAYDGDTIKRFIKWRGQDYDHIVAFEPDHDSFVKLEHMLQKHPTWNCSSFELGVYSHSGELFFEAKDNPASCVTQDGTIRIRVAKLDDFTECLDATFIKIITNGGELECLKGMSRIIDSNHPILSVCISWKDEDMVDIVTYVREKYPFYDLYVRQHSMGADMTVLYAVDPNKY